MALEQYLQYLVLNWQNDEKDLFRTTETNNILQTKVEEIISSKD